MYFKIEWNESKFKSEKNKWKKETENEKRNEQKTSLRVRRRTCNERVTHLWSAIVISRSTKKVANCKESRRTRYTKYRFAFCCRHIFRARLFYEFKYNNAPPSRVIKAQMIYLFKFKVTSGVIFVCYEIFTCVLFSMVNFSLSLRRAQKAIKWKQFVISTS